MTKSGYEGGRLTRSVVDIADGPDSITDYGYDSTGNIEKVERTLDNGTKIVTVGIQLWRGWPTGVLDE